MTSRISAVRALEILDSRGNPTVRVFVDLDDGTTGTASVPSGASTGENEAIELRDNNTTRYNGKGVRTAVDNVRNIIAPELIGIKADNQIAIDRMMIDLDGTENKANLGANAILGVSMAAARAAAQSIGIPLYRYLGGSGASRLPVPMMNILNVGEHADNSVDFQEFMAVPLGFEQFSDGLRAVAETFHALKKILKDRNLSTGVGDEGGFAPNLGSNEEAMDVIIEAIRKAGYQPGTEISLALDSAASSFSSDLKSQYELKWSGGGSMGSKKMIALAQRWLKDYPIVSWEDPLAEADWDGFCQLTGLVGDKLQIVGDDIFVTNTRYIERGIDWKTANSVLIKLNQIGTVTETIEAIRLCRDAGWSYIISHRSGETEDTFIADFAVAMDGGQIKTGSASRSDRVAKYNRLLEIEYELGKEARYYWKR
ncbi:MAG: phosphopyruvate hydratase [Desulfocapsaceae bacterium]|jgi:enolase|nr:phosphopyruvate hydratase [Desulfocapsaceae bacterium]